MRSERQSTRRSEWIRTATGAGDAPVPASVLAEWQRYQHLSWASRRRHYALELSSLLVVAAIPVLAAFDVDVRIIAGLGSAAVLLNGIRALAGYKESWTSRTQARYAIEREIALFAVRHGRYADPGAESVLVETVEQICAAECEGWAALRLSYNGARDPAPTGK